jgi:hypothetical protein
MYSVLTFNVFLLMLYATFIYIILVITYKFKFSVITFF